MNLRKPPVLATWLLKRSGIADGNAPLAGDLLEEFQSGRSAAWYWRQTFMAIATGMCRSAWVTRRYLGAFSIGYAAQACIAFILWRNSWQPILHGIALTTLAVVMAILLLGTLSRRLWRTRDRKDPGSGLPKVESFLEFTFLAVTAFGAYLVAYCLAALLWRQSLGEWAFTESIWFWGFIVPDLTRPRRQPRRGR
jgi:hypothetical protein